MIRILFSLFLIFALTGPLLSCTTPPDSDDTADQPIEDDESATTGDGEEVADEDAGAEEEAAEEQGAEVADEEGEEELDVEEDSGGEEDPAVAEEEGGELEDELEADNTPEKAEPSDEIAGEDLEDDPAAAPPAAEAEPTPVPTPAPAEEKPELARVRDIRFLSNASGGTVVIETTKPVIYQSRMNPATKQFVIELADVELPASLQKPVAMRDFKSRIGSINAYQTEGSNTARIVVQMNENSSGEPIVQQEGTSLVVIPPAAPPPIAAAPSRPSTPSSRTNISEFKESLSARTLDEFLTGNQKFYGRPISLQVKDADVRDVINFLAEDSGANVVMSDDVEGNISLKLRRIPWDQALVTVMRTKSLGYVRQGNVIRISTLKSLQAETEATSKILEAQKAIVPAVVQVVAVSYADLDELTKNVQPFLSKDGRVAADKRTSTLIITDNSESVTRAIKLVKTLDVPPGQVSIESKIVEAVEEFDTFVGVNWNFTGSPVNLSASGGANNGPIDLNLRMNSATLSREFTGATPFSTSLSIGTLDIFGNLTAALQLAERDALAKVISAPRISAMNREKAVIRQDGENVTIVSTMSETTGAVSKTEKRTAFALELAVTPQITSDGGVIMDLDVRREFLGPLLDAETGARAINKRSAKTKVLVRNGQTAVIGGIYTSDETESSNGVPVLKNIPLLGWLFKSHSTSRSKNELLIFLTPRIVASDIGMKMAQGNEEVETGSPDNTQITE